MREKKVKYQFRALTLACTQGFASALLLLPPHNAANWRSIVVHSESTHAALLDHTRSSLFVATFPSTFDEMTFFITPEH